MSVASGARHAGRRRNDVRAACVRDFADARSSENLVRDGAVADCAAELVDEVRLGELGLAGPRCIGRSFPGS